MITTRCAASIRSVTAPLLILNTELFPPEINLTGIWFRRWMKSSRRIAGTRSLMRWIYLKRHVIWKHTGGKLQGIWGRAWREVARRKGSSATATTATKIVFFFFCFFLNGGWRDWKLFLICESDARGSDPTWEDNTNQPRAETFAKPKLNMTRKRRCYILISSRFCSRWYQHTNVTHMQETQLLQLLTTDFLILNLWLMKLFFEDSELLNCLFSCCWVRASLTM